MAFVPVFVDDATLAARAAEVPAALFNSGMLGGGGGPGLGIGPQTGLEQSLPNWTLLDQFGNGRDLGQRSQYIGGSGYVDRSSVDWPSSGGQEGTLPAATIRVQDTDSLPGDGSLSFPAENAILVDLADGWEEAVTPP